MNIVIGLIGAKRAGKTTAFNAISSVIDVQEITLASKLKDVCAQVLKIPRDYFDSHNFKEKELEDYIFLDRAKVSEMFKLYGYTFDAVAYDKYVRPHVGKVLYTPRQIAQYVGTEILRNYSENIHCDSACNNIVKDIGVVTDMRFMNEYEYFSKNYQRFYPIYIQNVGAEIEAGKDAHASEAYLKDLARLASKTLHNNGSKEAFEEEVKQFIKEIL